MLWLLNLCQLEPIHYFEGDILAHNPEAYGFFYCKITSPKGMHIPLVQTRVKDGAVEITIAA